MKVKLKDFQIFEGTVELEFPVGITVITGTNACGKSSIFYAVKYALTNPTGINSCINYNHNKTEVTIENNNSITWTRTASSSEYTNNKTGEHFISASKLDSRDLADLGFYFTLDDEVFNIHDEWRTLFPFGESAANMFRAFEDIFNVSNSFQILDEIKNDEQLVKHQIAECQSNMISLQQKKSFLHSILDSVNINQITEYISQLNNSYNTMATIIHDLTSFSINYSIIIMESPKKTAIEPLLEAESTYNNIKLDYDEYVSSKGFSLCAVPNKLNVNLDINNEIQNDFTRYSVELGNINKYTLQLQEVNNYINNIREKLSSIRICPTCGQEIK